MASLDLERGFVYVPTLGLHVAKGRILQGKDWFESHKELQSQGSRMPTIPEFVEFLKYTKSNLPDVYEDITEVRSPWRGEWLDADFKVISGVLHINYNHILDSNGNLVPENSEPLDEDTLMQDRRISLDSWLNNPTGQGLPRKDVDKGELHYWNPRRDDNSVARFVAGHDKADLGWGRVPSVRISDLGVRAVRR